MLVGLPQARGVDGGNAPARRVYYALYYGIFRGRTALTAMHAAWLHQLCSVFFQSRCFIRNALCSVTAECQLVPETQDKLDCFSSSEQAAARHTDLLFSVVGQGYIIILSFSSKALQVSVLYTVLYNHAVLSDPRGFILSL